MQKSTVRKGLAALLMVLLLTSSFAMPVSAAVTSAPLAQQLRDKQVRASIPGGQFAKIWLGLEPEQPGATVTVSAEWDRPDASRNGVGFFILDESGLRRVGEEALSSIAIAAGDSAFFLNGASNIQGAAFNAVGLATYTIVVYNDSASDANFTLTATNGFITDESNQVTGVNSAPAATGDDVPAAEGTPAPSTAPTTTVTVTATTAAPAPVATTVATTTTAPAATTTTTTPSGEARGTQLSGDLPNQDDQHFLGLEPSQRDADITLRLTYDPQDSSELARRLNFWVLDEDGLTSFLRGTSPGELAIAAGNRTFTGPSNERVASFKGSGLGTYTVIVYNNSRVPGSYTLSVEGGVLVDGSGQTRNAQAGSAATTGTVTATTTTTPTTTTGGATTTATTGTTTTQATTTTAPARAGQPGGTYTVRSGDTIALIARDIYGDFRLYEQICAFNGIANCDLIEVGDVIRLPTQAQIDSGATAATTTAATPTATPTRAAATRPAASTAVTTTRGVTTTGGVTATQSVTRSTAVTPTTSVTSTQSVTATGTTTETADTTSPTTAAGDIVETLADLGDFSSLVDALQATGLDSVLQGDGPFTLFAPTDAAFAALPAGAFEQLLNDPSGQLTDILRYHVVPGSTLADDLSNGMQAVTAQGKPVRFEVQGTAVKINGANVITKDIVTTNGVIHVIDAVILPPPE